MKTARVIAVCGSLLALIGCSEPKWSFFHLSAYPTNSSYPARDGSIPERLVRVDVIRERDTRRPNLHAVIVSVRDPKTNKTLYRDQTHLDLVSPHDVAVEWEDSDAFTVIFSEQQKRQYLRSDGSGVWSHADGVTR